MLNSRILTQLSLFSFWGLGALLLLSLIYSSPLQERLIVHRSLDNIPTNFVRIGDADSHEVLNLTIALAPNNASILEEELLAVSDPTSPRYRHFLNKSQVDDLIRPSDNVTSSLQRWLSRKGIRVLSTSSSNHHVKVQLTVSKAKDALNATFSQFIDVKSNKTCLRTKEYSLPSELLPYVDMVYPTVHFPKSPGKRFSRSIISFPASPVASPSPDSMNMSRRDVSQDCDVNNITPTCVQSLYNLPSDPVMGNTAGTVILSIGQAVQAADIASYMHVLSPQTPLSLIKVGTVSLDGEDDPQSASSSVQDIEEADMDHQAVLGLNPTSPVTNFLASSGYPWPLFIEPLLDQGSMPSVVSISYGNDEQDLDPAQMDMFCRAAMQLGIQGTTIIAASGDSGVGNNCAGGFVPIFPASCPYVTAVGGTLLNHDGSESAAQFSGGGFSDHFAMPSYQTNAVQQYLNQIGSLNQGLYNASGRAYPDVAAIAEEYLVVLNGQGFAINGTSVAAPVFAAVIGILNAQLQRAGKSSLGFINPLLYSNPQWFHDITQGSNPGCNTNGFPATAGWDPVTGLGTPDFAGLASII